MAAFGAAALWGLADAGFVQGNLSSSGRSAANATEDRDRRVHLIAKKLRGEILSGKFVFPMLTETALEILQASQKPDLSIRELQRVVQKDPAIVVRVLQCANSSLYSAQFQTTSLRAAAMRLGARVLRELMARAVAEAVLFRDGPQKILEQEQEHAVRTATLARAASELIDTPPETAYLCGLLHDIGRSVLWARIFSKELRAEMRELGMEAANDIVDLLHPLVGERVLRSWGLPALVGEVARFHHCFRGTNHGLSHKPMICIVAASDRLAHRMAHGEEGWEDEFLNDPALMELDLEPSKLRRWIEFAKELPESLAA